MPRVFIRATVVLTWSVFVLTLYIIIQRWWNNTAISMTNTRQVMDIGRVFDVGKMCDEVCDR